jgi:UDP-N-acetylmuramoyl-tripeptide--D-alanyl-D-alanine ligase
MPVFAHEKLAAWTGGRWTRLPGGVLTGFTQDTRTLGAGQVFVALKTEKRDGHDFLAEARSKGGVAALVAHEVAGVDLPQLVVADPLLAFQRIAHLHRREFSGAVVGVTGSAGKTSTKDLLALLLGGLPSEALAKEGTSQVLATEGNLNKSGTGNGGTDRAHATVLKTEGNLNKSDEESDESIRVHTTVLKTEGNLNNHIGVPLTLTRLDPDQHTAAVVEAGINTPGEMAVLARMIEPDHSIVTLVGPAHLEKLGSLDDVAFEKSRLPAANRVGGLAVFPVGCWQYAPFRELAGALVLVPANESMVRVDARKVMFNVFHRPERTEITFEGRRAFLLRRVSSGMAQNAALALALASELGVEDGVMQQRLADWQPSKWRGELQQVGDAIVYCDFYNANPASMADAIVAFASQVREDLPRLYVIGCMEELGAASSEYHRQLGRSLLLRPGDFLFVIGAQAVAVRAGLLENGNDPAQVAVIDSVAPVRERLAGFKGAVFLKASRRYQLETVLDPHALAHA